MTGERELWNHSIIIQDGKILDVVPYASMAPEDCEVIDMSGKFLLPGFIDLQVNGGGSEFFTHNISKEAVEVMYKSHLKFGTTRFLPTLISTSKENILNACNVIKECQEENAYGVLGMHLEGPYFNMEKKGAHYPKFIREPQENELNEIIEVGKEVIKIITVAPEKFSDDLLKLLVNNFVVSAGHSNATYDQAKRAFNLGIKKVTHLFNAMSQFNSRNPGLVGAFFDEKDVFGGIIVDGVHCDFASVRAAHALKKGKLFLVSDASFVDNDVESFEFDGFQLKNIGGNFYTEAGNLAGSSISMLDAVRNCVLNVGISLEEVAKMASTYPAQCLGIQDEFGKIKAGYVADLVVLDNNLNLESVIVEGKEVVSYKEEMELA